MNYSWIKKFEFLPSKRTEYTMASGIRISNAAILQLKANDDDEYPVTFQSIELPVAFPVFNELILFNVEGSGITTNTTGVCFKVNSDYFYWDAGSWTQSGTPVYNTLSDFSSGLSAWTNKTFSIILGLKSADVITTPTINVAKLLFNVTRNPFSSLVHEDLPSYISGCIVESVLVIKKETTSDTINLDDFNLLNQVDVTGISAVYDTTSDPDKIINLYDSYTSPVITLTSSVSGNSEVWVDFKYTPSVYVQIGFDWYEIAKIPSVHIETVSSLTSNITRSFEYIKEIDTNKMYYIENALRQNMRVTLGFVAERSRALSDLLDGMWRYLQSKPQIKMLDIDRDIDLIIESRGDISNFEPSAKGAYTAGSVISFVLKDVPFGLQQAIEGRAVEQLTINMTAQ